MAPPPHSIKPLLRTGTFTGNRNLVPTTPTTRHSHQSYKIPAQVASDSDERDEDSEAEVSGDDDDGDMEPRSGRMSKEDRADAEHKKVIADLKGGVLDAKSVELGCQQYNRELLAMADAAGMTLLHKIISHYPEIKSSGESKGKKGREKASIAVKLCLKLIKWNPDLLTMKDYRDRETPLYVAIIMAKPPNKPPSKLIEKMLDLKVKSPSIKDALLEPCGAQDETCLHAAVRFASKDYPLVHYILEAKPLAEDVNGRMQLLNCKDKNGLTPLHYAVSLRFSDYQWEIIQKLTMGAPQAIFEAQDKEKRTPLHLAAACTNTILEHVLGTSNRTTYAEQSSTQLQIVKHLIKQAPQALRISDANGLSPYEYRVKTYPQQADCSTPRLGPYPTSAPQPKAISFRERVSERSISVVSKPRRTYLSNKQPLELEPSPDKTSGLQNPADDDVTFYLIDEYMHLEDQNDTLRYLYGACPNRHITFDIQEETYYREEYVERMLSKPGLKSLNSHWIPERILRYVAIPAYPKKRQIPTKGVTPGRTDMIEVFKWLRSHKVKKVIEVIVDDSMDPPHSDESIEKALDGLQVERLDWKRDDIDIDTIIKAAPNLERLCLYCSGRKSVLRSWSGVGGLGVLANLKEVRLVIKQGIDSKERLENNLEFFKRNLIGSYPGRHIEITTEIAYAIEVNTFDRSLDPDHHYHDHVEEMQKSGAWFAGMKSYTRFLFGLIPNPPNCPERIKVALIDDGVDGTHPLLASKIKWGVSYNRTQDRQRRWRTKSYCSAPESHGTQMALLICHVCPQVELYVARLNEGITPDGRRQIEEESAIKAIRWAVAQNVDIISMSWTLEKTESNSEAMDRLRDEVDKANKEHILMFASTDDKGLTGPDQARVYPTCLSHEGVIRIGAAKPTGTASDWSGIDVDYVLPGENIEIDDPAAEGIFDISNSEDTSRQKPLTGTGSSYATALAAGVAALIMYSSEFATKDTKEGPKYDRHYIKKSDRLKKAFTKISTSIPGMPKYLNWNHFQARYDGMDDEKAKDWLKGKVKDLFN